MNKIADVQDILNLYNLYNDNPSIERDTFLNVINKNYDENLISSLIAYLLANDISLLQSLIKNYSDAYMMDKTITDFDLTDISINTEKYMGYGRADIFIEIPPKENDRAGITITIENKINTWEHDNQTKIYFDWVQKNYSEYYNVYYFLRPDYNKSDISCDKFLDIRYSEFREMISETDNPIICDLKNHIKQKLEVSEMSFSSYEKEIVENYKGISNMLRNTLSKVNNRKDRIIEKIEHQMVREGIVSKSGIKEWKNSGSVSDEDILRERVNFSGGLGSYRLYRKKWYDEDKYYFYVEIKFHNDTEFPFYITFQETIKGYKYSKDTIFDFLKNDIKVSPVEFSDPHFVILKEKFDSCNNYSWDSQEWEEEFVDKAVEILKGYITDIDNKLFKQYVTYFKSHQK